MPAAAKLVAAAAMIAWTPHPNPPRVRRRRASGATGKAARQCRSSGAFIFSLLVERPRFPHAKRRDPMAPRAAKTSTEGQRQQYERGRIGVIQHRAVLVP